MNRKSMLIIAAAVLALTAGMATGVPASAEDAFDTTDQGGGPWVVDIEELTLDNTNFRTAKWTGKHMQMTVMSIEPGGEIGLELHNHNDQFIRIENGHARVVMGDAEDNLTFDENVADDWAILIPAGVWHNVINTGEEPLKVYVLYGPPEHPHGTVHRTFEESEADHHHHH